MLRTACCVCVHVCACVYVWLSASAYSCRCGCGCGRGCLSDCPCVATSVVCCGRPRAMQLLEPNEQVPFSLSLSIFFSSRGDQLMCGMCTTTDVRELLDVFERGLRRTRAVFVHAVYRSLSALAGNNAPTKYLDLALRRPPRFPQSFSRTSLSACDDLRGR